MQYKVSVIVPIFNAQETLIRCLDSIWNQTINPIEIICVNDGSTDNSLKILIEYQRQKSYSSEKTIRIIDKANDGPSSARNAGLDMASGSYVAFVDSDDVIEPDMYQRLIEIAEIHSLDLVMCNIMNEYPDGREIQIEKKVPSDTILNRNDILNAICPTLMTEDVFGGPCNRIYKKEYIDKHQIKMPANIDYGEDAVFQMKVFDYLEATWFESKPLYHYIHRENSQSSPKPGRFAGCLEPLYRIRKVYGKRWGIDKSIIANYFVYCSIMDMITTVLSKKYNSKMQYLNVILRNQSLREALAWSNITRKQYSIKIYMVYKMLRLLYKSTR